jgi:hypothetical protein
MLLIALRVLPLPAAVHLNKYDPDIFDPAAVTIDRELQNIATLPIASSVVTLAAVV